MQCALCGCIEPWQPAAAACGCGGTWTRAALPDIVAGQLPVGSVLGAGGMGVVYKATRSHSAQTCRREDVASLVHRRRRTSAARRGWRDGGRGAGDNDNLWGGAVARHAGADGGVSFEGGTLADRLRGGRLPIETSMEIGSALAEALVYMHATNRFHGDIKPSNIGFTIDGTVKFLDFGLSRTQGDARAEHPTGGTLAYLSPEVLDGAATGAASDVWALSVTLFQMLTGYHPFMSGTETVALIRTGLVDGDALRVVLPPPLADLLVDLLGTASGARPSSAAGLLERMVSVQNGLAARSHV